LINKVQREEDLAVTLGGLEFVRHYNSAPLPPVHAETRKATWDYWRHTYMRRIVEPHSALNVLGVAWRENGQMDYYGLDGKAIANLNGGASTLQKTINGWTLTQSNGDKEYYDDEGKLLSIVSIFGATQTLTYSDQSTSTNVAPEPGLLITVTDGLGNQLHLGYDDASRLISMTDPASNTFEYLHDDKDEDDRTGNLAQVIYPDQTTRSYLYDDTRWKYALTGVTDSEGNRLTTYTYGSNGEAVSTEQIGGIERYSMISSMSSQSSVRSTTITNALGGRIIKTYLPQGGAYKPYGVSYYPCSGSGCSSSNEYFYYDTNGNLSEYRTALNNYSQYTYDLNRNLEIKRVEGLNQYKQTTPATRTTSTAWHPTLRLPIQVAEPQKITTITYGAAGRVLTRAVQETNDANGSQGFAATLTGAPRVWTNTYNLDGQLIKAQSPDGTFTAYIYYPVNAVCSGNHFGCRGQMQSLTDSQGLTTTFDSYDALGRLLESTDSYGVVTTQTYDWRGHVLTRTEGPPPLQGEGWGGDGVRYTYDSGGNLIATQNPDGSALNYTHDAAGRLIRLTDNDGNAIDTTYDAMSNKTAELVSDPQGNLSRLMRHEVDAFGALQRQIDAANAAISYTYDAAGNLTAETDPLTRKTQYQYDTLNRVTQATDALGGITKYAYNGQSQLTEVTDPRGLKTTYTYNGFGELLTQTSPDTGVTSYTYDAAGRLTGKTDAKGNVTTYSYDSQSRLIGTSFLPPQGAGGHGVSYTYDQGTYGQGRLTGITEGENLPPLQGQIVHFILIFCVAGDTIFLRTKEGYSCNAPTAEAQAA
jgi:YD repeat-containing protein